MIVYGCAKTINSRCKATSSPGKSLLSGFGKMPLKLAFGIGDRGFICFGLLVQLFVEQGFHEWAAVKGGKGTTG